MQLTRLDQIFDIVKNRPAQHIAAAWATDLHTIEAIAGAVGLGLVDATLVGDTDLIKDACTSGGIDPASFKIIHTETENSAAEVAVKLVNSGNATLLMKGSLSTDKYMRAILNKEHGVTEPGAVLSHVAVMKIPVYHKILILGDVAVIPLPDLKQKIAIVNYLIRIARALGTAEPKLALLAATEQVLPGMAACTDAAIISKMAERNQLIKGAIVDGPLSLDLSINMEAVGKKGIYSSVAGDADCLLFPNIESGNVFYKTVAQYGGSEQAAILMGARVPAILSSRGDSVETKLYSIALATMLAP